jgi:hypothetical protein
MFLQARFGHGFGRLAVYLDLAVPLARFVGPPFVWSAAALTWSYRGWLGASPASSLRYLSAQSNYRNSTFGALLAAFLVALDRIRVPNPTAGIEPDPLFSGIRLFRSDMLRFHRS